MSAIERAFSKVDAGWNCLPNCIFLGMDRACAVSIDHEASDVDAVWGVGCSTIISGCKNTLIADDDATNLQTRARAA